MTKPVLKKISSLLPLVLMTFIGYFTNTDIHAQSAMCDASDDCWYAAPDGSGDVCTLEAPCSIEVATKKMSGGDTLYLLPGRYTNHYANFDIQAIINLDKFFNFKDPKPSIDNPAVIKSLNRRQAIIEGDFSTVCVRIDNSYVRIEGLVIRQCDQAGIRLHDARDGDFVHIYDNLIENIRGSDNMGGIYFGFAKGAIVNNNEFRGNSPSSPSNGNCYSIVLFQAVDTTIRDNYFHDTCGGIYFKHGENEIGRGGFTKIFGNRFERIGTTTLGVSGIWMNQNRAEIHDNYMIGAPIVIHPNVDGTVAPNSSDAVIHHNTLVDSSINLGHRKESPSIGALNASVMHNVFYNSDYSIWRFGSDQEFTDGVGLNSNSNCFFDTQGNQSIGYFAATGRFGNLGGNYSLTSFKSSLSFDNNSLEVDPQFVNLENGDYRLEDSSACRTISAGVRDDTVPGNNSNELCYPIVTGRESIAVLCL